VNRALPDIHEIWVYLSGSPLLALFLTLAAYHAGVLAYERSGRHPLANPVLIAVLLVAGAITAIDMPYARYFEGAQFVHFLLGTATVSLAVPIAKGLDALRGRLVPLLAALLAGGATSIASAVGLAKLLGEDAAIVGGLVAKSVTAPIAMGVAEVLGGIPALAATFVIVTGIIGAVCAKPLASLLRIRDDVVLGVATGVAAHGIGTARVFQLSETAGAFAGLAMGLTGLFTAVLAPILVHLLL